MFMWNKLPWKSRFGGRMFHVEQRLITPSPSLKSVHVKHSGAGGPCVPRGHQFLAAPITAIRGVS